LTDDVAPAEETPKRSKPRRPIARGVLIGVASVLALLIVGVLGARLSLLTPQGRAFVQAKLEGLPLGPVGKLHVEGLQGDVLGDFAFRRLAIIDTKGAWLDARDVHIQWTWTALFVRRAQIDAIAARSVQLLRPPAMTVSPPGPPPRLPVSIAIGDLRFKLETLPAISVKRGLFNVTGRLRISRRMGLGGDIHSHSLLHADDGLDARFNFGIRNRLRLDAQAHEEGGGALAGLAGLSADKPFLLDAHANGAPDKGLLHLKILSGADPVAQLDGGWTQAGGSGQGRISLAASRWTSGVAHMFGPELRLSGAGKGLGHNAYDLTLHANSDNASINLAGVIDADKQASPKGLKTQIAVADLSRIIAQPAMGGGGVNGLLSGSPSDLKLAGALSVEKMAMSGYVLARVSGPAELTFAKGEWRVKGDLKGQGGQGQGLIAALAGGAPRAVVDASRLADGRLLLRSLKADGAGLKLEASGSRSLFGALDFKGGAQISNLAAARAGAKGSLDAKWSASQGKATGPWTFTADATGAGLATGMGELDRLLGPKPALHLAAAWDKGVTSIAKAQIKGAAANASGSGQIGKAGELKLAIDWTASGPFTAGPLEIAGQAKGAGAITGTLALPRADLMADFERIDVPNLVLKPAHVVLSLARTQTGVDGLISIAANSDYGLAHGKAGLHFVSDGVSLTDMDLAAGGVTAQGALALHNASPSSADLTMTIGPGAFATQGHAQGTVKLVTQSGGGLADVKLTAENFVARGSTVVISSASLTANGALDRLPYRLQAAVANDQWPLKLDGAGVFALKGSASAVSFNGQGRVRHADFKTLAPAVITFEGPRRTAKVTLAVGGGQADITGEQNDKTINARAALTNVDLAALGEDVAGKVSANVSLSGAGSSLAGQLDAQLAGARSRDASSKLALDGHVHATLAGSTINLDAQATGASSGDKADVSLALPAEASAAPFRIAISRTRPLSGRFAANGELQPIWDLFFGGEQSLGGALTAQGNIAGTLNAPKLTGHATLAAGKFEDSGTGLKLRNVAATVDLSETRVEVSQFNGTDIKSGTVSGTGQFSLAAGGESTLTLNVKGFQLLDNDNAKATATGAVTVTRATDGKFKLTGALNIDQANLSAATRAPPGVLTMDVVERNLPAARLSELKVESGHGGPAITLDITLRANRHVFVRGLGINAELSLNASVGGTLAHPVLSGKARVVRGDYDFAGKRFEFDDQGYIDLDTSPEHIRLNLSATWDGSSLTAVIKIRGTAAKPEITLTSTPVLPQDEVLSQVLFGSSASQLSPVEAAQLAAAVTALATGGGFDVMGGLSRFARLDRLALGGDEASGVTVSGGKYIGNHLYLELTGGGRYGPSAQVEYRANRAFSLISQIGGLGGAKLSVRWRHDYGKAPAVGKPKP
jgi:translocation and assembly module TamB